MEAVEIFRKALQHYPNSSYMRRQYYRQMRELMGSGKHLLINGKFPQRH